MDEAQRQEIHQSKFHIRHISSALELIEILRLSNPRWKRNPNQDDEWMRQWIFRGQADSTWALIPSAWRQDDSPIVWGKNIQLVNDQIGSIVRRARQEEKETDNIFNAKWQRIEYAIKQAIIEIMLTREFIEFADSLGHSVPTDDIPPINQGLLGQIAHDILTENPQGLTRTIWLSPAFAFAQHHGIPTRLLDWTRNPLAAAYFAASDAAMKPPKSGALAVYAMPTIHLGGAVRKARIRLSENEFLRSQEGILLVDTDAESHYRRDGIYPDLMTSLFGLGGMLNPEFKPYKFILSAEQAPELLRLLFVERITRAHLMPTMDNVARTIQDKWRFAINTQLRESPTDDNSAK